MRMKVLLAARRSTFDQHSLLQPKMLLFLWFYFWYKNDAVQPQTCFMRVNRATNCYYFIVSNQSCIECEKVNAIVGCLLPFGTRMHIKIWWRKRCEAMKSPFNSIPWLQRVCDIQYSRSVARWKPHSEYATGTYSASGWLSPSPFTLTQLETTLTTMIRSMPFTCLDDFHRRFRWFTFHSVICDR